MIDVREPAEYAAGCIPTAINIPIASQPDALFSPDDEFEERFGFPKPGREPGQENEGQQKEVIFYCKAGVRSRAAAVMARQAGFAKIGEYNGSWLDWERNGGRTESPR